MFKFDMPQSEMAQRILIAAEVLMAREGVQQLSTHKIAKEAKLSVGSIYLHFKDKDDLLSQLALFLFQRFHQHCNQYIDPNLPLFEQYRQLWLGKWRYLLANPTVVMNIHQYQAIPKFHEIVRYCFIAEDLPLNRLFATAKQQKMITLLPNNVIYALSFGVAWDLAYTQLLENMQFSDEVVEEVILRTWKAVTL